MRKMKMRFFTIADYEEEEAWLREQHRNGLRLVNFIVPCFFFFEPCEPEDMVYRLDFKNACPDEGYRQMFSDYGWEYVGSCIGWLYFRKPASQMEEVNDGEIFSDTKSKLDMIEHVIKTRMLPILVIFLCVLLPGCVRMLTSEGEPRVLMGVYGLLFFLYVYLLAHCGRKFKMLKEKYKTE